MNLKSEICEPHLCPSLPPPLLLLSHHTTVHHPGHATPTIHTRRRPPRIDPRAPPRTGCPPPPPPLNASYGPSPPGGAAARGTGGAKGCVSPAQSPYGTRRRERDRRGAHPSPASSVRGGAVCGGGVEEIGGGALLFVAQRRDVPPGEVEGGSEGQPCDLLVPEEEGEEEGAGKRRR